MISNLGCVALLALVAKTYAVGYFGPAAAFQPMAMPVMFQFANQNQNREKVAPEVLTCINKDDDDQSSQIRLTLTSTRRGARGFRNGFNPMGAAFAGDDFGEFNDFNDFGEFNDFNDFGEFELDDAGYFPGQARAMGSSSVESANRAGEWRLDGTLIPSMSDDKSGTYQVVLTQYGRITDGCSQAALGPVYNKEDRSQGQQAMGFHGLGMGMGMQSVHPLGSFSYHKMAVTPFVAPMSPMGAFWNPAGQQQQQQQQQARPTGLLANPAIVAGSATVYSGHIEGVSKNDLLGRAIALCPGVQDGQCVGEVTFCCAISRDHLPAMELFLGSDELEIERGDNGFQMNFGNQGNMGMGNNGMGMNQAVSGNMNGGQNGGLF